MSQITLNHGIFKSKIFLIKCHFLIVQFDFCIKGQKAVLIQQPGTVGKVFLCWSKLVEGFRGNVELAESTNHLLVVGFYLVNLGFVLLRMQTNVYVDNLEHLIIYQASGLGLVLLVLGFAHFFNMYVIHRISRSTIDLGRQTPSRKEAL